MRQNLLSWSSSKQWSNSNIGSSKPITFSRCQKEERLKSLWFSMPGRCEKSHSKYIDDDPSTSIMTDSWHSTQNLVNVPGGRAWSTKNKGPWENSALESNVKPQAKKSARCKEIVPRIERAWDTASMPPWKPFPNKGILGVKENDLRRPWWWGR